MLKCQECKHWKRQGPGASWGDCWEILHSLNTIISNSDGGATEFETTCDFGCILGERHPGQEGEE